MRVITFLSDFSTRDWFVAAVKGEMLKIAPDASIVDITHDIAPYDVRGAAFLLSAVFKNFPSGTVHLAVVDPGVGGERKPLIIESEGYYFVGPDNGIFSYVSGRGARAYEINAAPDVSPTFHARDIFGPAAARLASGRPINAMGKKVPEFVRIDRPGVKRQGGALLGEIVYIDRFGNCLTSIPNREKIGSLQVSGRSIPVRGSYSDGQLHEPVCVMGSTGYYEIAVNQGSARELLKTRVGMVVEARPPVIH